MADLRAPTPSAAAELAVPEISKVEEIIRNYQNRYRLALKKNVELMKLRYEKCMQSKAYKHPLEKINENYILIDNFVKNMMSYANKKILMVKKDFTSSITRLDALSPLKTLARGYGIVSKDDKVIKSSKELNAGDKISIRFTDGPKDAQVL